MRPLSLGCLTFAALLGLAMAGSAALANDTSAELSVGGLILTRTADVALESEDLVISPELVTVRYRFLNRSAKPVTLTIAFPMPDIDLSAEKNLSIPQLGSANYLGFETKVDGTPVQSAIEQNAFLGGDNVSDILRKAGLALLPAGATEEASFSTLSPAVRDQLLQRGLLLKSRIDDLGHQFYQAGWTVKTAAVWQQTFPPGRPVIVEHRYHTSLGVSFDSVLRKGLRQHKALAAEVEQYRKKYCIGSDFLARLDRLAGAAEANTAGIQERRISYVLKTGANWAGPIKDFRLTIDKQKPDRLLSFCPGQGRAISPTRVQFSAKDFTPTSDLNILLVGKF